MKSDAEAMALVTHPHQKEQHRVVGWKHDRVFPAGLVEFLSFSLTFLGYTEQVNPFPSMLIATRGRSEAKIGGRTVTLQENEMMFIPAGVSHEFWNPYEEPAEGILLMFGDGA